METRPSLGVPMLPSAFVSNCSTAWKRWPKSSHGSGGQSQNEEGGTKDDDAYYFFVLLPSLKFRIHHPFPNYGTRRDCRGYVSREDLFIYLFLREEKNPNNVGNVSLPDSKRRNAAVSRGCACVCVRSRDLTRCSFVRKTCIFVGIACLFFLLCDFDVMLA